MAQFNSDQAFTCAQVVEELVRCNDHLVQLLVKQVDHQGHVSNNLIRDLARQMKVRNADITTAIVELKNIIQTNNALLHKLIESQK